MHNNEKYLDDYKLPANGGRKKALKVPKSSNASIIQQD